MTHQDWIELLNGKPAGKNQYNAHCPAHDDQHASLRISTADPDKVLVYCHAGCSVDDVVAAVGKTTADLYISGRSSQKGRSDQPEAIYHYTDVSGKAWLEKCRMPGKQFFWQHLSASGAMQKGRAGAVPALYGADSLDHSKGVFWVEGERDTQTLRKDGFQAVCAPDGAKGKLYAEQLEPLRGMSVAIIPDNDKPGMEHAQTVAAALQGIANSVAVLDILKLDPKLPEHGDISDIYATQEGVGDKLRDLLLKTPVWSPDTQIITQQPIEIIPVSMIEPKTAEYLFYPYLPRGKFTVIAGVAGSSKTWLVLYLATVISNGGEFLTDWQGGIKREPGIVIYQTRENDYSLDIRPRLDKLGANLDNILVINDRGSDGSGAPLTLTDGRIEMAVKQTGASLVVFDPFQSYLGEDVDMHKANEVRPVLDRIIDIGSRYNCTFIIICHMSKMTTACALDRILGSSDLRNAARSILIVGSDPDDPETRVFAHAKSSIGRLGESVKYHIDDTCGIVIDGFCDLDEDEIIQRRKEGRDKPSVSLDFTKTFLADFIDGNGGYALLDDIKLAAEDAGIGERTLYRAKKELGLQNLPLGYGGNKKTWWITSGGDKDAVKNAVQIETSEQTTIPTSP